MVFCLAWIGFIKLLEKVKVVAIDHLPYRRIDNRYGKAINITYIKIWMTRKCHHYI